MTWLANKTRLTKKSGGVYTVKSLVVDVGSVYGTSYGGIREIDLYLGGVLLPKTQTDYTAYGTNWFNTLDQTHPKRAFDYLLSLTGSNYNNGWMSTARGVLDGSLRIICVYNTEVEFDEIQFHNYHDAGAVLERCVKDIKIYTTLQVFTDAAQPLAPVTDGVLIFDGAVDQHVDADVADPQILTLI